MKKKNTLYDFKFKGIKFEKREWCYIKGDVFNILFTLMATITFYGAGFYLGKNISPVYYYIFVPFAVFFTIVFIYLVANTFFRIEYYTPLEVKLMEEKKKNMKK